MLAGLRQFDQERQHIDAGWAWAMAHAGERDADALLNLYANATAHIGDLRYDVRRERIPQLEAALAAARRRRDRRAESAWLGNLGLAYDSLGEHQRAIVYHEQSLKIAREIGDRRGEGRATWNLGLVYEQQGDLARAVELMQAAVHIKREIGDPGVGDRVAHLERLRQRLTQSQQVPPS